MGDESIDSGLGQSRDHVHPTNKSLDTEEGDSKKRNEDLLVLQSLLTDWGATSVLHLRWVLLFAVFRSFSLFTLKGTVN